MAKVLLIGDSISLDYGTCLPAFLNKEIIVYDKPGKEEAYKDLDTPLGGNGGDSSMVLQYLRELQEQNPDAELYFIMGADMFLTLRDWRNPEEIFRSCTSPQSK